MVDFDGGAEFKLDTSQAEAALERLGNTGARSLDKLEERIGQIEQKLAGVGGSGKGFDKLAQGADKAGRAMGGAMKQAKDPADILDKRVEKLTRDFVLASSAVTQLTKATLGINTPALTQARAIMGAYRNELALAVGEANKLGLATANVAKANAAIKHAGGGISRTIGDVVLGINKVGFTFFALEQTLKNLLGPVAALKRAFFDVGLEIENAGISLAGAFNAANLEDFNTSQKRSISFMKELREEALKTNLNFDELLKTSAVALPQLLARGFTEKQSLSVISNLSSATKTALGPDFSPSRVQDELRGFLTGQVNARTSQTLQILGFTSEELQSLKTAEEAVELLEKRMIGFNAANEEFRNNAGGAIEELKDVWLEFRLVVGEPIFEVATDALLDLRDAARGPEFKNFVLDLAEIAHGVADVTRELIALTAAFFRAINAMEQFNQSNIQPFLDKAITGVSNFIRERGKIPFVDQDNSLTRLEQTRQRQNPANKKAREQQREREEGHGLPAPRPRDPNRPQFGDPTAEEVKKAKREAEKAQRDAERDAEEAARREEQAQKERFKRQRDILKGNNERQAALIEIASRGNKELAERMKKFSQDGFFPPSVEMALQHERDAIEQLVHSYEKGLDKIKNAAASATTVLSAFADTGIGAARIELEALEKELSASQAFLTTANKTLPQLKKELEASRNALDTLALSAHNSGINASISREREIFSKGLIGKNLIHPTGGTGVISSGFGVDRGTHRHGGIDVAAPTGTPVLASLGGKVTHAGPQGAFGNLVKLEVGDGLELLFAHLSKVLVKVGDQVEAGKIVGAVGSTGRSSGPHLHLEARQDGKAINPSRFLSGSTTKLTKEQLAAAAASVKHSDALEHMGNVANDKLGLVRDKVSQLQGNYRTLEEQQEALTLEIESGAAKIIAAREAERKAVVENEVQLAQLREEGDRLIQSLTQTGAEKTFAAIEQASRDADLELFQLNEEMDVLKAKLAAGGEEAIPGIFRAFSENEITGLTQRLNILQATIEKVNAQKIVTMAEAGKSAIGSLFGEIDRQKNNNALQEGFFPREAIIRSELNLNLLEKAWLEYLTSFKAGETAMINGKGIVLTAEHLEELNQKLNEANASTRQTMQSLAELASQDFQRAQASLDKQSNFLTPGQSARSKVLLNNSELNDINRTLRSGILDEEGVRRYQARAEDIQAINRDIANGFINTVIDPIQQGFESMFDAILEGEGDFGKIFLDTMKNIVRGLSRILLDDIFGQMKQNMLKGSGLQNIGQQFLGGAVPNVGSVGGIFPSIASNDAATQLQQGKALTTAVSQGVDQSQLSEKVSGIATAFQGAAQAATGLPGGGAAPGGQGGGLTNAANRKQLGMLLLAGFGLGQISQASRTADETGRPQAFQGALGGILSGIGLGSQLGPQFGLSSGKGALLGGIGGGLFGLTQGFPETSAIRQVGGGILGGAMQGFMAAGPVGGAVGGILGGIMGLFGLGKARKAQRQAERHAYQDNVLAPFLNKLVGDANQNDIQDLRGRLVQASRGMKGNGERGMEMKRAAMEQIRQMINAAKKRADEISKGLDDLIADMKRPVHLRDTVPELKNLLKELKEALDLGVDPNKVFEAFQAQIQDQVREMQDELNEINEQIIRGDENQRGELISLQEGMRQRIIEIQKEGQKELEALREGVAADAGAIISEGRASAIIPGAASRQERLSKLFAKAGRDQAEIKEDIANAILREQNQTAREIADLQSEAVKIQQNILLLLEEAIKLAPGELKRTTKPAGTPTFGTAELQQLLEFVKSNQFGSLTISANALGGLPGVTIENLNISNTISDAELGRLIREEIERREQAKLNNRTAQAA